MPQVFQVLKCYKCLVFQVHQTKKSNKFQCKMCGEKQSIKRHYGLGNGQECRKHVQKLNAIRGEIDESTYSEDVSSEEEHEETSPPKPDLDNTSPKPDKIPQNKCISKWSNFVETERETATPNDDNDTMYLNNTEVVLELPKKRQKTLGCFDKRSKLTKNYMKSTNSEDINNDNEAEVQSHDSIKISNAHKLYSNKQNTSIIDTICHEQPEFSGTLPRSTKQEKNILNHRYSQANGYICKTNNSISIGSYYESQVNDESSKNVKPDITAQPKRPLSNKQFIPPLVDKNSKWAKFAQENEEVDTDSSEETEENEKILNSIKKPDEFTLIRNGQSNLPESVINNEIDHTPLKNSHTLFSLCDDNELDDFLTI